jgi:hypothetical protein
MTEERAVLKVFILFFVALQAHAVSQDWVTLGNGAGYAGVPPYSYDGPFFLIDPIFTCPNGSHSPKYPGFREQIRLDHFGPDGCSGSNCHTSIYAWQSSCGGPVKTFEMNHWEKSQTYHYQNDAGSFAADFNIMIFENHLYVKQAEIPDPERFQEKPEVYCHSISTDKTKSIDRLNDYELLIRLLPDSSHLLATVYWKETDNQTPPFHYTLKVLQDEPVSQSGKIYSGDDMRLELGSVTDSKQMSSMVISANGKEISIPMTCVKNL